MALFDFSKEIKDLEKKLDPEYDEEPLTRIKEGRTWQDIAMSFVNMVRKMLDKHPEGFNVRGEELRKFVGDPNNWLFRNNCRKNGVRVLKMQRVDIYNIKKFDIVAMELKKNELR